MTLKAIMNRVILSCLAAALLAGCGSSKKAAISQNENVPAGAPVSSHFDYIVTHYPDWKDVSANITVAVTSPSQLKVSGKASMVRDESIDISLRVLGMEMGRLLITRDSVYAMVKPSKIYLQESLREFMSSYGFSVANIQQLLIGEMFLAGDTDISPKDASSFKLEAFSDGWTAVPRRQPKGVEYGFMVNLADNLQRVAGGNDRGQFSVDYDTYTGDNLAKGLAEITALSVTLPKNSIAGELRWRWDSARWNQGITSSWSVPKGFKRVRSSELMKLALNQ